MSMYGDQRMHMEEWQVQLMERAKEVGPQQALSEFGQVMTDFLDVYWTEKQTDDLRQDAERYRWLCNGNGYFMEEERLCHIENEKQKADVAIDRERSK